MNIRVGPRKVALPWENAMGSAPARVCREGDVQPDRGPLEMYQSVFPDRYVKWEPRRQLWEIRQRNPFTGFDERVELIFEWAAPPDPETGEPRTAEELAYMLENRHPSLTKVYAPFDYEFVRRRLRERLDFLLLGTEKYQQRITARNRRRQRSRLGDVAREMAAGLNEIKRWLPVLETAQREGVYRPHERTPLVRGGLTN
jgi:hypothetical protein